MSAAPDFVDWPDLAAAAMGGVAIAASDEGFGPRSALLTDDGAWESHRRRDGAPVWCTVRLGLAGRVHGVVIDTSGVQHGAAEACSVEACAVKGPLDLAALDSADWIELVPRARLQADAPHFFAVSEPRRFTHVRLRLFPDGGVGRLRVHGEGLADPTARTFGGVVDLAAMELGGLVLSSSDGSAARHQLLAPRPAGAHADGWSPRRRRASSQEWAVVRLAGPGTIQRLELDTSHFVGDAPVRCVVEACQLPREASPDGLTSWRSVLDAPLQPDTRHVFTDALRRVGPATHVKLTVFPDGGLARVRVWGELVEPLHPALARLNAMTSEHAANELLKACGSKRWATAMAWARPFENVHALFRIAEREWWKLAESDYLEAFAAHPRIGGKSDSKWSKQEQAGAAVAAESTLERLQRQNDAYFAQNGFIYIVCATGKSADEMLGLLEARLAHDRATEIRTAAEEQAKITIIRLTKWLEENSK